MSAARAYTDGIWRVPVRPAPRPLDDGSLAWAALLLASRRSANLAGALGELRVMGKRALLAEARNQLERHGDPENWPEDYLGLQEDTAAALYAAALQRVHRLWPQLARS